MATFASLVFQANIFDEELDTVEAALGHYYTQACDRVSQYQQYSESYNSLKATISSTLIPHRGSGRHPQSDAWVEQLDSHLPYFKKMFSTASTLRRKFTAVADGNAEETYQADTKYRGFKKRLSKIIETQETVGELIRDLYDDVGGTMEDIQGLKDMLRY
ncbi:hypothetical protein ABW19_dt0200581 [Dactylella cylindrospora]|nr:hypothetical protein ABW19_dt0200581 [Dactylella cylindrospora]